MKRLMSIVFAMVLVFSLAATASAEVDLSGLTFDELIALKDQINLAIWNCEEWQEVEVPQGVWEVGADIPAGKWEIKAKTNAETRIIYGTEVKNGGTGVSARAYEHIKDPGYRNYDANKDVTSWIIEVKDGEYLQIEYGSAIFMPYSGKTSLGFK